MKLNELKEKTDDELRKLLSDLQGQMTKFMFDVSVGEEKNVRKGRGVRKAIAQLYTILRERHEQRVND